MMELAVCTSRAENRAEKQAPQTGGGINYRSLIPALLLLPTLITGCGGGNEDQIATNPEMTLPEKKTLASMRSDFEGGAVAGALGTYITSDFSAVPSNKANTGYIPGLAVVARFPGDASDSPDVIRKGYARLKEARFNADDTYITTVPVTGDVKTMGQDEEVPLFRVGSITKTFVAMTVLQMIQEQQDLPNNGGTLALDTKVGEVLTENELDPKTVFYINDSGKNFEAILDITVSDLLRHEYSGLAEFATVKGADGWVAELCKDTVVATDTDDWTAQDSLDKSWEQGYTNSYSQPMLFAYSNANYEVLGRIVNKLVSGKAKGTKANNWRKEIKDRFIDGLLLSNTYVLTDATDTGGELSDAANISLVDSNGVKVSDKSNMTWGYINWEYMLERNHIPHDYENAGDYTCLTTDLDGISLSAVDLHDGQYDPVYTVVKRADPDLGGAFGAMVSSVEDLSRWVEAIYEGELLNDANMATFFTGFKDYGLDTAPIKIGYGAFQNKIYNTRGHPGVFPSQDCAIWYWYPNGIVDAVATGENEGVAMAMCANGQFVPDSNATQPINKVQDLVLPITLLKP